MPSIKLRIVNKGGPGSGFYDHAGRPGKVGGSTSVGILPDESAYVPAVANIDAKRQQDFKQQYPKLFAAIGDAVVLESDVDNAIVADHLAKLDTMPSKVLKRLRATGTMWYISDKSVPYSDDMQAIQGTVPRGWEGSGHTWDSVGAAYDVENNNVILGRGLGTAKSIAAHETGHAIYEKLVRGKRDSVELRFAYSRIDQNELPGYFKQPNDVGMEELFAESWGYTGDTIGLGAAYGQDWANTFSEIVYGLTL